MTTTGAEVVRLEGALTMRSVGVWVNRPLPAGDVVVDFSAVGEADSAALALLLEWMRRTRESGGAVTVRALPAGLLSLAALYDLSDLLSLSR